MYVGASQPHTHKLPVRDVRTRRTPAPGQTCSRAPHAPLPPVFLNREVAVFLQADGGRSPETRFLILNSEAYCSQITATLDTNSHSGSFPIAISETLANAGLQREGRCEHSGCTALCRSGGRGDLPQTHASPGNQRPQAPRQRNRGLQRKMRRRSHPSHCPSLSEGARPSAGARSGSDSTASRGPSGTRPVTHTENTLFTDER